MNSSLHKMDSDLRARLDELTDETNVHVEIIPQQYRWPGLLRHLRTGASSGASYNVMDLTAISAHLPKWLIEATVERRDVVRVRLHREVEL